MKKVLLVMAILIGFVVAGYSEDLAEVAKKEKARREALKKEGKKPEKVYTNKDIPNLKSSLGIESSGPEPDAEAVEPGETGESMTGSESEGMTEPAAAEEPAAESQEQAAAEPATEAGMEESSEEHASIEELRAQKEELDKEIAEKQKTVGQAVQSRNVGSQYQELREAEEKSEALDQKIRELEQSQESESDDLEQE